MVRLLRHRQTKGAVTDRPNLRPPRHILTLLRTLRSSAERRVNHAMIAEHRRLLPLWKWLLVVASDLIPPSRAERPLGVSGTRDRFSGLARSAIAPAFTPGLATAWGYQRPFQGPSLPKALARCPCFPSRKCESGWHGFRRFIAPVVLVIGTANTGVGPVRTALMASPNPVRLAGRIRRRILQSKRSAVCRGLHPPPEGAPSPGSNHQSAGTRLVCRL